MVPPEKSAPVVLEAAAVLIPPRRAVANRAEGAPRKGKLAIRDMTVFSWQMDMTLAPLCNISITSHEAELRSYLYLVPMMTVSHHHCVVPCGQGINFKSLTGAAEALCAA